MLSTTAPVYRFSFFKSVTAATLATMMLAAAPLGCSSAGSGESAPHALQPPTAAPVTVDFNVLLSAAFAEYARSGTDYAELHHRYLGVTQPAPNTLSCPEWPDVDVGNRILRLGFVAEEPLHTVDSSGRHIGFEAELAAELVRRINEHYEGAHIELMWVPVDVALPVGPSKNSTAFRVLAEGLRNKQFDVAFSCIVPVQAPDITYLCPTMTMFPGIMYTGRDKLDVSGIHDRESLVAFLVANPGMTFMHGMGVSVYDALAAEVAKAGGSISVASGGMPHFRMADIVGLSKMRAGPMRQGVLLDVNPRTSIQHKAPFALKPSI